MKKILVPALLILTSACAVGYNPRYYYNELQAANLSGGTITDVRIQVGGSGRVIECDTVLKNALCYEHFGKRPYPQQGIDLSWTLPGGERKSELLTPPISVLYSPAFPLRVILEINADGTVKAYYKQDDPGRDGPIYDR
jgi:hypothetical protein